VKRARDVATSAAGSAFGSGSPEDILEGVGAEGSGKIRPRVQGDGKQGVRAEEIPPLLSKTGAGIKD
jgi:hypothetical protein